MLRPTLHSGSSSASANGASKSAGRFNGYLDELGRAKVEIVRRLQHHDPVLSITTMDIVAEGFENRVTYVMTV